MTDEIIRVSYYGDYSGQEVVNVFTFHWVDPLGVNDIRLFIKDYLDTVYDVMLPKMNADLSMNYFNWYRWLAPNWIFEGSEPYTKVGTDAASEGLPLQSAAVILGKVDNYRAFGRKFFPAITEVNQLFGNAVAGLITAMTQAAVGYISAQISGGISLTPGILGKTGVFHAFVSGVVDGILGTQRRRKAGVGS